MTIEQVQAAIDSTTKLIGIEQIEPIVIKHLERLFEVQAAMASAISLPYLRKMTSGINEEQE